MARLSHERVRALSEVVVYDRPDMTAPRRGAGRLVQVFFNVNMAKQHLGLIRLSAEHGIDLQQLVPGQYVVFMNRARTRVKLFTCGNTFAYCWLGKPGEVEVSLDTLRQIPQVFGGSRELDFQPEAAEAFEIPALTAGGEEYELPPRRKQSALPR